MAGHQAFIRHFVFVYIVYICTNVCLCVFGPKCGKNSQGARAKDGSEEENIQKGKVNGAERVRWWANSREREMARALCSAAKREEGEHARASHITFRMDESHELGARCGFGDSVVACACCARSLWQRCGGGCGVWMASSVSGREEQWHGNNGWLAVCDARDAAKEEETCM